MKVAGNDGRNPTLTPSCIIGKATLYFGDSSKDLDLDEPRFLTSIVRDDANQQWLLENTTKQGVMVTFNLGTRPPRIYRLAGRSSRSVKYRGTDQLTILGEANWNLSYGPDASNQTLVYEVDSTSVGDTWWLENSSATLWLCYSVKFISNRNLYSTVTDVVPPGFNNAIFPRSYASQWVLLSAHFDDPDYSS